MPLLGISSAASAGLACRSVARPDSASRALDLFFGLRVAAFWLSTALGVLRMWHSVGGTGAAAGFIIPMLVHQSGPLVISAVILLVLLRQPPHSQRRRRSR